MMKTGITIPPLNNWSKTMTTNMTNTENTENTTKSKKTFIAKILTENVNTDRKAAVLQTQTTLIYVYFAAMGNNEKTMDAKKSYKILGYEKAPKKDTAAYTAAKRLRQGVKKASELLVLAGEAECKRMREVIQNNFALVTAKEDLEVFAVKGLGSTLKDLTSAKIWATLKELSPKGETAKAPSGEGTKPSVENPESPEQPKQTEKEKAEALEAALAAVNQIFEIAEKEKTKAKALATAKAAVLNLVKAQAK